MSRVNYRTVIDRFSHIDAEFVDCKCEFNGSESFFRVKFYPWWEHPLYVEAVKKGNNWGFRNTEIGAKEVTVYPVNPIAFHISYCRDIIDWGFAEEHPLLWSYEDHSQIIVNGDVDVKDLICAIIEKKIPFVTYTKVFNYLNPIRIEKAPYSLGDFPLPLFTVIRNELERMKVPVFIKRQPKPKKMPILFLIDDEDYIIADDFFLEVPEFQHLAEWFTPYNR